MDIGHMQRETKISRKLLGATVAACIWSATGAVAGEIETLKAKYKRPDSIPFPASNPYSLEKMALGKALFFEPRLSAAQNMNCASCHNPSFGWEVPVKTAVGSLNTHLTRQAPTILNMAWLPTFFWDGRAATLEDQAKGPIESPVEMNLPLPEAKQRLSTIPHYKTWFEIVFPGEGVTEETIVKALATYQRTVVGGYAPFDKWIDGDDTAISQAAKRGFELFNSKARCSACHSGWNFTDNKFHDIGISTGDRGRAEHDPSTVTAEYAFKTPGLREIELRAPYMHNGELATLEDVMMHYVAGGIDRPSRSPLMGPVELNATEIADLIAFMKTLTGAQQTVALPILPH